MTPSVSNSSTANSRVIDAIFGGLFTIPFVRPLQVGAKPNDGLLCKLCKTVISSSFNVEKLPSLCNPVSSILRARSLKQMVWITAEPVITLVKQAKVRLDFKTGEFVGEPMRPLRAVTYTKRTVSVTGASLPLPAFIRTSSLHFLPKTFFDGSALAFPTFKTSFTAMFRGASFPRLLKRLLRHVTTCITKLRGGVKCAG